MCVFMGGSDFDEVSREQNRCSCSGARQNEDLLKDTLFRRNTHHHRLFSSLCKKKKKQPTNSFALCLILKHAHTHTYTETHTQTHAHEAVRTPWWVSSNPAPALVPENQVSVAIITHTYIHTQKTLILSHLGPVPNPTVTLIPDHCWQLKRAWNQWGNRWINTHCWSMFSWVSSCSK